MIANIDWQWHALDDLTSFQMQEMFALRQDVFIVEQDCVYQDIDGKDQQAFHLLGWQNGQLIATLRVFECYQPYANNASFGRVCTHYSVRNSGVGKLLISEALKFIDENFPTQSVQIGAQYYLKNFYQAFGFEQVSDIYDEDGIDHVLMLKT